jgi:hypothetical protein
MSESIQKDHTMQLVLTSYLGAHTENIEERVAAAVPAALAAAAARIDAPANDPRAEARTSGVALRGVDILEGAEINWERNEGLTTMRVVVPWNSTDGATGHKLIAANRFAQVFSAHTGSAA